MWEQVAEYWRSEVLFDVSDCFVGEEYPTDEEVAEYKLDELRMKMFNEFVDMIDFGLCNMSDKEVDKYLKMDRYFSKFDHAQKMNWIDTGIMINIHNTWKGGKK